MITHRSNNFDFIRLVAALAVMFSHQFALLGLPEPLVLHYQTLGGFAVLVFFSVSGYLITSSWQGDPHLGRFAARRLLRIWPGLICTVLLCGLLLGPLVTTVTMAEYWKSPVTHQFFRTLFFSVSPFLPGVFPHSPLAYVPNGVLWTIPIELRCYGYLAILGMCGILRLRWLMLSLLVCMAGWYFYVHNAELVFERNHTHLFEVEYASFFFASACFYLFRDAWNTKFRKMLVLGVLWGLGALAYFIGHSLIAAFLVVPYSVVLLGTESFPVLRRFGRFGDLSYGVYIYAFPVQQTVIWLTPSRGFTYHLAIALSITLMLAWLSWHLVEDVALGFKPSSTAKRKVLSPRKKDEASAINA